MLGWLEVRGRAADSTDEDVGRRAQVDDLGLLAPHLLDQRVRDRLGGDLEAPGNERDVTTDPRQMSRRPLDDGGEQGRAREIVREVGVGREEAGGPFRELTTRDLKGGEESVFHRAAGGEHVEPGVLTALRRGAPLPSGGVILGFDVLGWDWGTFHSYTCNGLEAEFDASLGIRPNAHGFFSRVEDARKCADHANLETIGAEPALWLPWLTVAYDGFGTERPVAGELSCSPAYTASNSGR